MKFIKRAILAILILTTVAYLFRGWLYRNIVTYYTTGIRTNYSVTNDELSNHIDSISALQNDLNIKQTIALALSITSNQLIFSTSKNDNDPNDLINSKIAHCIGYASFFTTTCNYLLKRNDLVGNWIAKPQVGELYVFGINIHDYFKSSFFKDHDFVTIENEKTGQIFAVDPTVHDYLHIDFISFETQ
jgi:hypothetical protein